MRRIACFSIFALALACGSTEPESLPDLTGLYSLVSYTVDGLTETPPRVSAVLGLMRHAVEDEWMVGTMRLQMSRRIGSGSVWSTGTGAYRHGTNGRMVISWKGTEYQGTYTLNGDTLVTSLVPAVAHYPTPGGELVWVLDDSL